MWVTVPHVCNVYGLIVELNSVIRQAHLISVQINICVDFWFLRIASGHRNDLNSSYAVSGSLSIWPDSKILIDVRASVPSI